MASRKHKFNVNIKKVTITDKVDNHQRVLVLCILSSANHVIFSVILRATELNNLFKTADIIISCYENWNMSRIFKLDYGAFLRTI